MSSALFDQYTELLIGGNILLDLGKEELRLYFLNESMQTRYFSEPLLTELRVGVTSIKHPPLFNSSVVSRSSMCRWILRFYIVRQRDAYLTCHTINTISSSHPARPIDILAGGLSPESLWRRPLICCGGLAATGGAESRPGKITERIPAAQTAGIKKNKSSSPPGEMRDVGPARGGRGRMLLRDHVPSSLVSRSDEKKCSRELTVC